MTLHPLLIGPAQREVLDELAARAAASPTPYATMKALAQAQARGRRHLGDLNRALTVELPVGYTVTLTHEEHRPGVMCRHVSVGLKTRPGRGPTPEAVNMVLAALGFVLPVGRAPTWTEALDDETFAVNVLEPLSGNVNDLSGPKEANRGD